MDRTVVDHVARITFGNTREHENMAAVPLFGGAGDGPAYITLAEGLEAGTVRIAEVSEGGSVPDLRAVNDGDVPVLLLDGEELAGAKQNRVLNTTILVPAHSDIVVPVSCTESGRWRYASPGFEESGYLMELAIRKKKHMAVSASLRGRGTYNSNQGEVWQEIDRIAARAGASSPTHAMRDVFESRRREVTDYTDAFPCTEGQKGLLVAVNGRMEGLDMVSRSAAYARLHEKLVRSYVLGAVLDRSKATGAMPADGPDAFVRRALLSEGSQHPSVGLGTDHRFRGDGLVGSALFHDGVAVHVAFFAAAQAPGPGRMSGWSQRRGWRSV